jgi:hypothetical protein
MSLAMRGFFMPVTAGEFSVIGDGIYPDCASQRIDNPSLSES